MIDLAKGSVEGNSGGVQLRTAWNVHLMLNVSCKMEGVCFPCLFLPLLSNIFNYKQRSLRNHYFSLPPAIEEKRVVVKKLLEGQRDAIFHEKSNQEDSSAMLGDFVGNLQTEISGLKSLLTLKKAEVFSF